MTLTDVMMETLLQSVQENPHEWLILLLDMVGGLLGRFLFLFITYLLLCIPMVQVDLPHCLQRYFHQSDLFLKSVSNCLFEAFIVSSEDSRMDNTSMQ